MKTRRAILKNLIALGAFNCASEPLFAQQSNVEDQQSVGGNRTRLPASTGQLNELLLDFQYEAQKLERLKSAVISLHGETVFAESFRGPAITQAVNIKSVSKSVVATLLGVARHRGVIDSLDQTLEELVPQFIPRQADTRVGQLTLSDLVTMRAGLQRTSGAHYGVWVNSDNWIQHVLTRPFIDVPGGRMLYSTGDTHVLGAILSELTGHSLRTLANDWLGKPLNITFPAWTRDPQGYYLGGNEMSLSPVHLVKLGELYLNNGVFNGRRIFDADWAGETFTARTRSVFSGDGYGYGWFLRPMGGLPAAYARGFGGQVLHVVPQLQLAVAITSDATQRARSGGYMSDLHNLVEQRVVLPLSRIALSQPK